MGGGKEFQKRGGSRLKGQSQRRQKQSKLSMGQLRVEEIREEHRRLIRQWLGTRKSTGNKAILVGPEDTRLS